MKFPSFLLVLALAACGGGKDNPVEPPPSPPPKNPVTRVVLTTTDALVAVRSQTPTTAFVAHAYDKNGAEVPNPQLVYNLSPGWTLQNGKVVAPEAEARGQIKVGPDTVNYKPNGSASLRLASTSTTDPVADLTAGIDLRLLKFKANFTCYVKPGRLVAEDGTPIDSIHYIGRMDTTRYKGEGGFLANYSAGIINPVAQVAWKGKAALYRRDGGIDTTVFDPYLAVDIVRQAPDTIYITRQDWTVETGQPVWAMVKISSVPLMYRSRDWCPGSGPYSGINELLLEPL